MHPITRRRADDGQVPVEIEQPRQRAQQQVVALARHQRADRQDPAGRAAAARAARRVIGARHHHGDARARHAERGGEALGGRFAGDDHARQARQQALLEDVQPGAIVLGKAGLQRGRMVDQRHRAARRQRIVHPREGRQRQPVDQRPAGLGQCVPGGTGGVARGGVGQRMRPSQFDHVDQVAGSAQPRNDAPVIGIAARDGRERCRNDQRELHGAQSNGSIGTIGRARPARETSPPRRSCAISCALNRGVAMPPDAI